MSLNDGVETQKLKATFFHVLSIVMDGGSFRSSDPMSRKRSLYSVMFPDSKYTKINCGRNKATYILNHAIAPFARKNLQDSLLGKVFGLFVDESTYHNKVRLEYWVIFFSDSGSRTILGINRINDLCPTRFLSLFSLVNEACQQFPVVRKINMLSKEQDLIRLCTKDSFIVHLDQFVVHCAPLYYFVKGVQSSNISLHQCLIMVLELISKLLARLGHSVVLTPASFFRHLYDNGKPQIFPAKKKGFQYSIDIPTVQRALDNLDTEAIKNIIVSWNRFIELQLDRLLVRFHTFLSSPIVRYCFLMYKKTAQYTDRSISHLNLSSVAVGLNSANVLDESTALRMVTASSSLSEELLNQSLDMYPSPKRLVELILIIVPHNMVVEAGFSKMKFSESAYQSNLNSDTYVSMRFVSSHFCRESYDTFRIPPELISLMRKARSEYVKDVKKSVTPQDGEEKENIKVHLGIYERKTSASVAKEINKVDEDLKKA